MNNEVPLAARCRYADYSGAALEFRPEIARPFICPVSSIVRVSPTSQLKTTTTSPLDESLNELGSRPFFADSARLGEIASIDIGGTAVDDCARRFSGMEDVIVRLFFR